MAYAELEPFGEPAEFWRAGMLAAIIVNTNPYRKKGTKPAMPADFMPDPITSEPDPADAQDLLRARIDATMAAFGGASRGKRVKGRRA